MATEPLYSVVQPFNGPYIPVLRNLTIERLRVEKAGRVLDVQGLPGAPVRNITLRDCSFNGVHEESIISYTEGLSIRNVRVNGQSVLKM